MKRMLLVGRSGAGKTTLSQSILGKEIKYDKTQYISFKDFLIDTPGEYAENHILGRALALYSYEADIIGLLLSATEPYSLYPPMVTACANREVIGIITQTDKKDARVDLARMWLEIAGCRKIFEVSSITGRGIKELFDYLK